MKKIFFCSIALFCLASCVSSEDGEPTESGEAVRFSAVIDSHNSSRASNTSWEAGDKIGISGQSAEKVYSNVAYTTGGNGNFTVVTSGEEIYYLDNGSVTFTAYYPWNDLSSASSITTSVAAQANQKTFDFLWAQAAGSKAAPFVSFNFAHKMTKLVLTIKKGNGVSFDEVKAAKLTLSGFAVEGSFDTAGGTATAGNVADLFFANNPGAENNAPAAIDETAETVSYTLILFPQEFVAPIGILADIDLQQFKANFDFTGANTVVGDDSPKNVFVAGRQYNLSVTLHKTALVVEECLIQPWTEANGGNVDAK